MTNTTPGTIRKVVGWTAAALWTAALIVISFLSAEQAQAGTAWATRMFQAVLVAFAGQLSPELSAFVTAVTPALLIFLGYMGFAGLTWNVLRTCLGRTSSLAMSLAAASLLAVLDELHQLAIPGRFPRVGDWLLAMAGALCILAGIWLFQLLWRKCPRLVNRETVSYVIFGVLTTIVNIVVFQLTYLCLPPEKATTTIISNSLAWVLSVLFAYVVNKRFVFQSKTHGAKALLAEAGKFVGARVFSYLVDMAGMLLLINVLHVGSGISKIAMNVVVMIMNYFFSKWFIFKDPAGQQPHEPTDPS